MSDIYINEEINGEALKFYRNKANQTQASLADKIGCKKDQIYRWEKGESKKPRKRLKENLCKYLNVKWENLTKPPQKDIHKDTSEDNFFQLNRRVSLSTRTSMTFVSKYYGVTWNDIIEFSPLLFMVFAEQNLQYRKTALDETENQIKDILLSENSPIPDHMLGAFFISKDDDWIEEEISSIEKREVFSTYFAENDDEPRSPFTNHIKRSLDDLSSTVWDVTPNYYSGESPEYNLSIDILEEETKISKDNSYKNEILEFIQEGRIDLQEVLSKKYEQDYEKWLIKEYQTVKKKLDARLDSFAQEIKL